MKVDEIKKCEKELRRLVRAVAFCGASKKFNLIIATFGKIAEYKRLLSDNTEVERLENTS